MCDVRRWRPLTHFAATMIGVLGSSRAAVVFPRDHELKVYLFEKQSQISPIQCQDELDGTFPFLTTLSTASPRLRSLAIETTHHWCIFLFTCIARLLPYCLRQCASLWTLRFCFGSASRAPQGSLQKHMAEGLHVSACVMVGKMSSSLLPLSSMSIRACPQISRAHGCHCP